MQPVYLHNWGNKGDMKRDFRITGKDLEGVAVILAYYCYEDYSGKAFVLFRKDGKLYEVNGSHCSCYGLEDQWSPEETTKEALKHRLNEGWCFRGFEKELKEVLRLL